MNVKPINGEPRALRDEIGQLFSEQLNVDVPSQDIDLFETGVLDSLGFVSLLAALEEKFDVSVSLDDLAIENFRSIDRIVEFVVDRRTASQGGSG